MFNMTPLLTCTGKSDINPTVSLKRIFLLNKYSSENKLTEF